MADLVLDYALLHQLAGNMRDLKANIKSDVDAGSRRAIVTKSGGTASSTEVGNAALYGALSAFFYACHGPFQDSMDLLDKLADNFDGIAKAFFDLDADFAGKADQARLQGEIGQWQSDQQAYQHYLDIKDKSVPYQYYDEHGQLQTGSIPLWNSDQPPPTKPGDMPTDIGGTADVGDNHTQSTVDKDGNITSETTTVHSGDGLSYTETTHYTYHTGSDGKTYVDYTTTITHSDGTTETVTQKTDASTGSYVVTSKTDDGTSTSTVTPTGNGGSHEVTVDTDGNTTTTDITVTGKGTATKTVEGPDGTDVYTGNPDTGVWKLTSHTDPPDDNEEFLPPVGP